MLGFVVALHVLFATFLIVIILMQQSHGAGMSSVFGGGGSGSFFGGKGASPFLMKITIGLAVLFFVTSTSIAIMVPRQTQSGDVQKQLMESLPENRGIPMQQESFEEIPGGGEQQTEQPAVPSEDRLPELPTEGGG